MDEELLAGLFPLTAPPMARARALRTTSLVPDQQRTPPPKPGKIDPFGLQQRALEASQKAAEVLDAEPDVTPWQDYAKRRSEEGGQQLLLALAAQQAGKEFQPMAGLFLKQAMSAREPINVGKAGMITGEGQFIADPYYQREKQAEILLRRADTLDKLAVSAQTAQERAEAAAEARRARDDYQRMVLGLREQGLAIQREGMELRRGLAGQAAADRADREDRRREDGDAKRADAIRREYNARLAKVQDGAGFANSVMQTLAMPDITKNAPAQISLVMQFGKMLDPDSVVREAEQQMIANARGWFDSLGMTPEKIMSGVFLTPQQLAQMRQVAAEYARASGQRVDDLKTQYADLAQRNALRVEDVVLGYRPGSAVAPPAGAVREKGSPRPSAAPPAAPRPSPGGMPAPQPGVAPVTAPTVPANQFMLTPPPGAVREKGAPR